MRGSHYPLRPTKTAPENMAAINLTRELEKSLGPHKTLSQKLEKRLTAATDNLA